jgi:hypothetical protein
MVFSSAVSQPPIFQRHKIPFILEPQDVLGLQIAVADVRIMLPRIMGSAERFRETRQM